VSFLVLYSAQDHPGGRISSVFHNGGWIEAGAQWIHGQNNEVWKLAHKYDLLSTVTSSEGEGKK
jgi:monoamine oxidase